MFEAAIKFTGLSTKVCTGEKEKSQYRVFLSGHKVVGGNEEHEEAGGEKSVEWVREPARRRKQRQFSYTGVDHFFCRWQHNFRLAQRSPFLSSC